MERNLCGTILVAIEGKMKGPMVGIAHTALALARPLEKPRQAPSRVNLPARTTRDGQNHERREPEDGPVARQARKLDKSPEGLSAASPK